MVDNIKVINDEYLDKVFENRIIQPDNTNRNSEIFIYNSKVLKIYTKDSKQTNYNINNIKEIFKKYKYLKNIKELVLPTDILKYNKDIIGFSMPYIKGITLDEIIKNNLLSDSEIKQIFIKLLNLINKFNYLPFDFYIGDLHEKNIIIDEYLNINIIDPDSFILNNKKLIIDKQIIIGKYSNHYYNNKELKIINISSDYYCLLCMILNYVFIDIIEDKSNPVSYIKNDQRFKEISYIIYKTNNIKSFNITINDIDNIFNLKGIITKKENEELTKELKRIRKITQTN